MTLDRGYVRLHSRCMMFSSPMVSVVRCETKELLALGLGRTDACVDFVHDLHAETPLKRRNVLRSSCCDVISARNEAYWGVAG